MLTIFEIYGILKEKSGTRGERMYEIKFKDLKKDKNYVARFENPYQLEQFK